MKNVLFTTTALVALASAGVATAEAHADGAGVSFSGSLTGGYNDVIEDGLFWQADLSVTGTVDLGDGLTATATATLVEWDGNDASETDDFSATVEIAYEGAAFSTSLKFGDLDDEGASEYFYADRSGMAQDVENHDGDEDVRALFEFGNFGLAVGCDNVDNGECNDGFSVGAGATFGTINLGVGYDEADTASSDGGNDDSAATFGVSADTTFGAMEVGVSFASGTEDSIGVEVAYAISDMMTVGAYYASNSASDDGYGVSVDYASGPLTVGVFFDHTSGGTDEFGADVSYAVNDQITANAGIFNDGTSVFYVGMDYAVNDNVTATLSWADGDEIGGPEYKEGISAYITASF